jgi:hypothetical protein
MFHIASTRFNNDTLAQNMAYRLKTGESAIYGTGFQINVKYSIGAILFVFEMNNDENRIEDVTEHPEIREMLSKGKFVIFVNLTLYSSK